MSDPLDNLETRLRHSFADRSLLERALIHGSAGGEQRRDNERLEFLGDRVLGLLAAEALFRRYKLATEGELAPRLNALVRKEACAAVAEEAGLDRHIVLAAAEQRAGGRRKPAILADACEAVMAALYLDGGLEAARAFFETYWLDRLGALATVPLDAKTRLQEWAQGMGKSVPVYQVTDRSGPDHAPHFVVSVQVEGVEPESGEGRSKRVAEQAAALALLRREAPELLGVTEPAAP
ncbi:MAG: ribonuclease III [Alphaproteobacteria bacterium]